MCADFLNRTVKTMTKDDILSILYIWTIMKGFSFQYILNLNVFFIVLVWILFLSARNCVDPNYYNCSLINKMFAVWVCSVQVNLERVELRMKKIDLAMAEDLAQVWHPWSIWTRVICHAWFPGLNVRLRNCIGRDSFRFYFLEGKLPVDETPHNIRM